jgi:predicted nuclease of restriction endonuclease-like (RecB) superfamily
MLSPEDMQKKNDNRLLRDIQGLIETARRKVAQSVNSELALLYWHIGARIRKDILENKRAEYGQRIVHAVSALLVAQYGKGYAPRNLFNMIRFAEVYRGKNIVHALSTKLSWTHFRQIIYLENSLKRDFYAEMCRVQRWSTRTLENKIRGMLYERTALSKKPKKLITQEIRKLKKEDRLTPDLVFRDPYFLDFLGLKEGYSEKDLEIAILRELETFLLEIGVGFAFVERQKRITVDREDYYLDLLFYHRKLRRLVAIELKLGAFRAQDKGQMELYLRWLDENEKKGSEKSPIGLILCAGKSSEHVELLQLQKSGIRVAEYLTELPPRKVLEKKLHDSIRLAREQIKYKQIEAEKK